MYAALTKEESMGLYLEISGLIFPGLFCVGGISAGFGFFAPSIHQHEHDIVKIAREISSLLYSPEIFKHEMN